MKIKHILSRNARIQNAFVYLMTIRPKYASAFVTHGATKPRMQAFYRYDDVIRITLVTFVTLGRVAAKQRSGVSNFRCRRDLVFLKSIDDLSTSVFFYI